MINAMGARLKGEYMLQDILLPKNLSDVIIVVTSVWSNKEKKGELTVFKLVKESFHTSMTPSNVIYRHEYRNFEELMDMHKKAVQLYKKQKPKAKVLITY